MTIFEKHFEHLLDRTTGTGDVVPFWKAIEQNHSLWTDSGDEGCCPTLGSYWAELLSLKMSVNPSLNELGTTTVPLPPSADSLTKCMIRRRIASSSPA